MNGTALTAMALLLAGIVPAAAMGEVGTIEACRKPGVASISDGKPIELPAGSVFADLSDDRDRNPNGDSYRPVRLRLLLPLEIAASARCGLGRAEIDTNPKVFTVAPSEHRAYGPSGHFSGTMPEVVVHVVATFR
jgi:hypothetical protein